MMAKFRDPVSGLTHLAGALLSAAGLVALLWRGVVKGSVWHVVSFAIFGVSLVLLYCASAFYHLLRLSEQGIAAMRRVDHAMIYVLIAGTYTPFCLVPLRGPWGWSLLAVIWSIALVGIFQAVFWLHAPRWLSTVFYLVMGWAVVVATYPLLQTVSPATLLWLLAGGLIYSGGAVLYATKWPNPWPGKFGFHEIWHLFVMGGSVTHFLSVLTLS